jgi:hypothetical protein
MQLRTVIAKLWKERLIYKILSVPLKPREYFSCIEIQSQIISAKLAMQLRQAKELDMLRQSHQVINPPIFTNFQTLKISSTNTEESHLTGSSNPSPTTLLRHICSRNSVHCPTFLWSSREWNNGPASQYPHSLINTQKTRMIKQSEKRKGASKGHPRIRSRTWPKKFCWWIRSRFAVEYWILEKNIAGHKWLSGKSVQRDYMETVRFLQRKVPTAECKL